MAGSRDRSAGVLAITAPLHATVDQGAFLDELVDNGLFVETGVQGVYGKGVRFEEVRLGLDALLTRTAASLGAERMRFPPLLPRHQFEDSGFIASFPHLAGTIFAFDGTEVEAALQHQRASAHEGWSEFQHMTDLVMMPAACYPVYPAIARRGPLAPDGVFVDAGAAWVFRHEPSGDPARLQSFHQHELVRIGKAEAVASWRDEWAQRGLGLLRSLGLDAEVHPASDPFFGRAGRMLAASQREQALKLEALVQIAGPEPTAVASFNTHHDHFARTCGIELADGGVAHTACLGFGHERITLALLRTHGLESACWPVEVRRELWPA